MMLLEEALTKYLNDDSTIFSYTNGRVLPFHKMQDDQLPAITYYRVSTDRDYEMEGSIDLVEARMQLDIWARTYKDCKDMAERLRIMLSGYKGTLSNIKIRGVFQINEADMESDMSSTAQLNQYRIMQEYYFHYSESETSEGALR